MSKVSFGTFGLGASHSPQICRFTPVYLQVRSWSSKEARLQRWEQHIPLQTVHLRVSEVTLGSAVAGLLT